VENGRVVSAEVNQQASPKVLTYPEGLYYVTWSDQRNLTTDYDIYAYAIGAHGGDVAGWAGGGTPICTATNAQIAAAIVPDGNYGAIIVWQDYRNYVSGPSYADIYAQRVDQNGSVVWATDGVVVCDSDSNETAITAIPAVDGGAIIAWMDNRSGDYHVYAVRIDSDGNPVWTPNGVAVSTVADNNTWELRMVSDGADGAIITWVDHRAADRNIYAERLDGNGTKQWYDKPVCTVSGTQSDVEMVEDGAGGAIITWRDARVESDIYAQRIAHGGGFVWNTDGAVVCDVAGAQVRPSITTDGDEGAIVAWDDYRDSNWDVYAARIDRFGLPVWTTPVRTQSDYNQYTEIVADGAGGAIIAWWNLIFGGTFDVYASRLDASGTELWQPGGLVVSNAPDEQNNPSLAPDHEGGAFIAWGDRRDDAYEDIYALRIERNGYWGYPAPSITSVRDVPGDQGGYVNLAWDASRLDPWPDQLITEYSVWRAIDAAAAMIMAKTGTTIIHNVSEIGSARSGVIREDLSRSYTPYYWYLVDTAPAYHLDKYSMPVPTLFDSTAVSSEPHYFQVIAHTLVADEYWVSDAQSGYSVDNLVPCTPAMLAGTQETDPHGLELTWDPNTEADLSHYNVYRGTDEAFVPGEGNRVACTADTTAFDDGWQWSAGYWYKVSAVDIHGNESAFAVLGQDDVTGVEGDVPTVSFLRQNYPNPFNPTTTIRFGIDRDATVKLTIYDATGSVVRVLLNETRRAGPHTAVWKGRDDDGRAVASGVYFYRLQTDHFTESRKMVLLR
jgi:hypothetical protein